MIKNTKRENDLLEISRYRFAALETALYLDTHPYDSDGLERHNYFSLKLKELICEFEEKYNEPLSVYSTAENRWTYIDNWCIGNSCGCDGGIN